MNLLARFITRILFQLLFMAVIFAAILSFAVTSRQALQSTLVEADLYNSIVPAVLEEAQSDTDLNTELTGDGGIPLNDPAIQAVIEQSIEPEVIRSTTETILESTYNWLDGSSAELEFEIDLTATRDTLANNLVDYVIADVESKPECVSVAQADYSDVFNISCKPPGFSAEQVKADVTKELTQSEALEEWKVTHESFANDDGSSLTDDIDGAPDVYQTARASLWMVGIPFAVVCLLFVTARMPLKNGLHKLGKNFLINGIVMSLIFGALLILAPTLIENAIFGESRLENIGVSILENFAAKAIVVGLVTSVGFSVAGLVLFIVFRGYKPLENARANKHR